MEIMITKEALQIGLEHSWDSVKDLNGRRVEMPENFIDIILYHCEYGEI